ncbi:hypothetical protein OG21DRAFT_854892 [Imleria badia]|nr:hypothetical protein OG21DRAFT_854892 [Imleria badia]
MTARDIQVKAGAIGQRRTDLFVGGKPSRGANPHIHAVAGPVHKGAALSHRGAIRPALKGTGMF